MDESSSLVSLCQRTAVSLQILAIPSDVLDHTVLSGQLIVGREMTNHPVIQGGRERERYIQLILNSYFLKKCLDHSKEGRRKSALLQILLIIS